MLALDYRAPVALIDDTPQMRDDIATTLRGFDFEPVEVSVQGGSANQIVAEVLANARMAVCDQRLNSMTATRGAEIVAELTRRKVPAILYSQKKKEDAPELRKFFEFIPLFLNRDQLAEANLRVVFSNITEELKQGITRERKAYRTLIRVEELFVRERRASIVIPAWRLNESLEISTDDMNPSLRPHVVEGARFFGRVNLHAPDADDIFVKDFELAASPDPNDGLA